MSPEESKENNIQPPRPLLKRVGGAVLSGLVRMERQLKKLDNWLQPDPRDRRGVIESIEMSPSSAWQELREEFPKELS